VHAVTDVAAQAIADTMADMMRTLAGNTGAVLMVYGR